LSYAGFACPRDRRSRSSAGGLPVIIQETGFTKIFGAHRHGLIAFRSLGEIAEAVKEINAEIARQFFEAEKVLRSLLERAGI
jgi:hypothetical protein